MNQFSDEAAAAVAIAIADVTLQPHVMPAVLAPRAEQHGAGTSARRSAPAASARRADPLTRLRAVVPRCTLKRLHAVVSVHSCACVQR